MTGDPKEPKLPDDDEAGLFEAEPFDDHDIKHAAALARLKILFEKSRNQMPEIYGDDENGFVARLREISAKYHLSGATVLYPGSNAHAAVARAFGKQNVTHVDPEPGPMEAMKAAGYKAVISKKEDYQPAEKFDLIVSLNSGTLSQEDLARFLKEKGFVVANNYHGSANQMAEYDDFELLEGFLPHYEHGEWINAEAARQALGSRFVAVGPRGVVESYPRDPEAIEEFKNADALFVFRKKPRASSD